MARDDPMEIQVSIQVQGDPGFIYPLGFCLLQGIVGVNICFQRVAAKLKRTTPVLQLGDTAAASAGFRVLRSLALYWRWHWHHF